MNKLNSTGKGNDPNEHREHSDLHEFWEVVKTYKFLLFYIAFVVTAQLILLFLGVR